MDRLAKYTIWKPPSFSCASITYKKSVKDEDDRQTSLFTETPFKTNKSFQNIFFDNKLEFINFIDKFNNKTIDVNEFSEDEKNERIVLEWII